LAYQRLLERLGPARVAAVAGNAGKTSVAAGLATAAVLASRRVCLLECDLGRPTAASRLGLADEPGLSEYLQGRAAAAEILQLLVLAGPGTRRETGHLACVVAGRHAGSAAQLLASQAFSEAIAGLRRGYDLVVLDAPPDHADSSLLSVSTRADLTLASCTAAEARSRRWDGVAGLVVSG
jgi:Mrp family chromosome partitioning ATPase